MQFLEQLARIDLRRLRQDRGRGGANIGNIRVETVEKQLLGIALEILEAYLRQYTLVQAVGIRDNLDQVLERILGRMAQFIDQRNALVTLQVLAIEKLLERSLKPDGA